MPGPRSATDTDRPTEIGYPLREEALTEPGPPPLEAEPEPPVGAPPPRRRLIPALSPWPILLVVLLLIGGLGAAYGLTHKTHSHHPSAAPAPAPAPPPPASVPSTPPPPAPPPPPQATVPYVVGLELPKAVATLRQAGLTAVVRQVASNEPTGRVVGQNPRAGAKVAKNGRVQVDVSLQPLVVVPDVTGMQGLTASHTLTADHLVPSLKYVPSSQPPRTVVAQFPVAGEKVKRGTHVQINLSTGGSGPSGASGSSGG